MSLTEEEIVLLLTLLAPGSEGKYNKYGIDTTPLYEERLVPDGPPAPVGLRFDLSVGMGGVAWDWNGEFLWRPPSEYGPGQFGLFSTFGVGPGEASGELFAGAGGSIGPVVVTDIKDLEEYAAGESATIGGSYKTGLGLEVDVTSSWGQAHKTYYVGAGVGAEVGMYSYWNRTIGKVWE